MDQSKRNLAKTLGVAGVGAALWKKPVVDSISLPAHATTSELTSPQVYSFTGGAQTFVVPESITLISIDALGAAGGSGGDGTGDGSGGRGGQAVGDLAVTPGETLHVYVGGVGTSFASPGSAGGFNGGGNLGPVCTFTGDPAGTGGGASDIRQGGNTLNDRVLVAAGGGGGGAGGSGNGTRGGDGGGITGSTSEDGNATGGTQATGGQNMGFNNPNCAMGTDGALGVGGTGDGNDGGGGGGGYYGGGGGNNNGAGGGGSSYVGGVSAGGTNGGQNSGDGLVTISW